MEVVAQWGPTRERRINLVAREPGERPAHRRLGAFIGPMPSGKPGAPARIGRETRGVLVRMDGVKRPGPITSLAVAQVGKGHGVVRFCSLNLHDALR